jgi:hypothetical protein
VIETKVHINLTQSRKVAKKTRKKTEEFTTKAQRAQRRGRPRVWFSNPEFFSVFLLVFFATLRLCVRFFAREKLSKSLRREERDVVRRLPLQGEVGEDFAHG